MTCQITCIDEPAAKVSNHLFGLKLGFGGDTLNTGVYGGTPGNTGRSTVRGSCGLVGEWSGRNGRGLAFEQGNPTADIRLLNPR
ncbi:hypothetical protein [uncultured Litoreibacter sp.]|uniref:hypothetical protein n=1 Tax=uncultured Litoreibacter sp. TaxID=1392394 RepID=UPI00260199F8|nr:hypothetical protein [uncultured Litoreibacter sp.]